METDILTKKRIQECLSEGKRFDERKLDEFREIVIERGISKNAEGSVRVKLGKTEVYVGIKMDIGEPYPDSQDSGNLMVTVELLPLSSDRFDYGPPGIEAIELGRIVDRGIRESKVIDLKKLCIEEGKKVWTVFVDIYSINNDGNLIDAAGIGAIAALASAKIPKYDEETGKADHGEWTKNSIPLSKDLIFPTTVYKVGESLIVDPTIEEEDASEARITFGLSNGYLHSMQKGNSKELKIEEINEAIDLAEKAWKKVMQKAEKYLK